MGIAINIIQEKIIKEKPTTLTENEINNIKKLFFSQYQHSISRLEPRVNQYLNQIDLSVYSQMLETMGLDLKIQNRPLQIESLAKQTSYYIVNKIVYYMIIQSQLKKLYNISLPDLLDHTCFQQVTSLEANSRAFKKLLERFECAPLFLEDPFFYEIISSVDFGDEITEIIKDFREIKLINIPNGTLFELFQGMIPKNEQKAMGQIYTPDKIADFMVKITIQSPNMTILDPACGCGVLLSHFYSHLKNISQKKGIQKNHQDLLSQIWGVELNPFPAHLAMMALALSDPSGITHSVGVLLEDFLKINGLKKYFVHSKDPITGKKITLNMPKSFDAIIANPPYIKQERIANKGELSKLLTAFATLQFQKRNEQPDYNAYLSPIQKTQFELTGKTDLYGYFLWHSTFFLKEHGVLCFIIPNKWMDVQYGEKVKEFLLNHYRIDSLISFSQNQFEIAQVSTIILFAFRESNKIKRESQIVRFYQFDPSDRIDDFVAEILTKPPNAISETLASGQYLFERSEDHYTCTYVRQKNLGTSEKWSFKYLFQSHLSRLLHGAPLISMDNGEITRVVGGIKTGANEFFFPSPAEIKFHKIEQVFLKPGIKSGRNIPNKTIIREGADLFLSIPPQTNINVYQGLKDYIVQSEQEKKYHERPSVNWRPWYAIPEERQDSPDILFLRHIDMNFQAKWNQIGCIVADGVRGITILDKNHIKFYLGVCNSTFFYWMAHIQGRWEGQGDLQLLVYELRKFLIPDIRRIPPTKIQAVEHAIDLIIEYEEKERAEKALRRDNIDAQRHQERLDIAVLDCLNLSEYYNLLKSEVTALETMRLNKSQ